MDDSFCCAQCMPGKPQMCPLELMTQQQGQTVRALQSEWTVREEGLRGAWRSLGTSGYHLSCILSHSSGPILTRSEEHPQGHSLPVKYLSLCSLGLLSRTVKPSVCTPPLFWEPCPEDCQRSAQLREVEAVVCRAAQGLPSPPTAGGPSAYLM